MQLERDNYLDANSCIQSLSHPPWEFPALLTCHACRSPLGRDPYDSSLSQWLFNGGAYYRVPYTPCTDPSWSGALPTGDCDVAWKPPYLYIFTIETPRPALVPRPEDSTPCLGVAPSSAPLPVSLKRLLPVLLYFPSGPHLRVPPCWLWSTPEVEDRSVHKPPSLELSTCSSKRLWPRPTWWESNKGGFY